MAPPLPAEVQLRALRDIFVGRTIVDEFGTVLTPSLPAGGPLSVVETPLALPTLNTAFVDSASAVPAGSKKTIYLVVSVALTWVTSGQALWQPFASRTAFAAAGGATTQLTSSQGLYGSAQNLGAAAQTSLPAGLYRLSADAVAGLAWPDAQIGMELHFPSALTAGAALLFVEAST